MPKYRGPYILLFLQILAHMAIVPLLIWGQWWHYLVVFTVYFFNGCLGMTITYHRLLSHQSFKSPLWFKVFGVFCATIGLNGSALSWIAIHRAHHQFTDTADDPHSPKYKGWFWAHYLSMFSKVHPRFVKDLLKDPWLQFQHKYYYALNLGYALVLSLIDPFAVIYAWLVPAAIVWNAGSTIVSISHRNGSPHTDLLLGVLIWGEGYHIEHHQNAKAVRFGKYDLAGWLIQKFSASRRSLIQEGVQSQTRANPTPTTSPLV